MRYWRWAIVAVLPCLFALAIFGGLAFSWRFETSEIWGHLGTYVLRDVIFNTFTLLGAVGLLAGFLGVSLAWIVTRIEFPGRSWLEWMFLLPLAFPTYVYAFLFLSLFGVSGTWIDLSGLGSWNVYCCLSLALFPYVYLFAFNGFRQECNIQYQAARLLGASQFRIFWKLSIQGTSSWWLGGLLIVWMECLADFGAVSVFNYNTFTTAIYKTWFDLFSIEGAAQLSSLLCVAAVIIVLFDRLNRARKSTKGFKPPKQAIARLHLQGFRAWALSGGLLLFWSVSFFLPFLQLLLLTVDSWFVEFSWVWIKPLWTTFGLMCVSAALALLLSIVLALYKYLVGGKLVEWVVGLSNIGYALPGSLLAIAVVLPAMYVDHFIADAQEWFFGGVGSLWLTGTPVILLLGLAFRFFASPLNTLDSALSSQGGSLMRAAQSLGCGPWRLLKSIIIPLHKNSIILAFLLVSLEVAKELPLTLMARPMGLTPLSVQIFEYTSEGDWERAAFPSLILLLLGIAGVALLWTHSKGTHFD